MYATDTVLTLKQQRDPDEETGEEFPYNKVRVIGVSPVSHQHKGDWTGQDAEGVIVTPLTNFGATLDEPFGKLRTLYEISEVPDVEVVTEVRVKVIDSSTAAAGETPEEVFAREAPGTAPEEGQIRARTPRSPLGEMTNPGSKGPLDFDTTTAPVVGPSDNDAPAPKGKAPKAKTAPKVEENA